MILLVTLLFTITCLPLYGAVYARTDYDRLCDDEQQLLFLKQWRNGH